jgi:hypothetical protein
VAARARAWFFNSSLTLARPCACGSHPRRRRTVSSYGDPLRAAAVIDAYESRDLQQQLARSERWVRACRACRLPRLATPARPTSTKRCSFHTRETRGLRRRVDLCTSGDRDGGFGRPILYLRDEMPEQLAQRVGAADGHVAGTDGWHEVAVTNPMLLLKLGTPRSEGTRPSFVGSVPGRGEARSGRLSERDGSDRTRQNDTSRLAHPSRAQARVPGGARAPR